MAYTNTRTPHKTQTLGLSRYVQALIHTAFRTLTFSQLVFKRFIELAEQKVTEAQEKADQVQSTQSVETANVDDLEASETPESILLSTVSGEQSKDRTDRAIVTPWLKFLWETYRTVLDIFKNNSRLEIMYQSTAHQAFLFCSKYQRKTEFRRLCELLRNHLQNVAKFTAQMHAINLNDPDTLQRHLDTRFQQLNVAVELELYQEAFRSIEDIHTLLSMSKRPAKPIMMANYFEKLTRIFLVSENYLFHAAAWSRYYNLLRQSNMAVSQGQSKKDHPSVSESDMTKAASFVVLSALSIPVISTSRSRGALLDVDEARKSKNARLTSLLAMNQAPSRAILFKDAISKGLLRRCRPEIRELYNILEVDFHPLSICKRISPILGQIGADSEMAKYVQPLQQVILTRLFQQLSQVYESVKLQFVLDLAQFPEPFKVTPSAVEKFIMNGCKKGDLAIRIDHTSGVLTFDSDIFSSAKALHPGSGTPISEQDASSVQRLQSTPAEIVRSQLTRLAKSLFLTCQYVDPSFNEQRAKAKEIALQRAEAGAEQERKDVLARREVIDRKKLAASTALAQKEKDIATQKRIKAQQLQAQEAERLAEEQRERERRRKEADLKRVKEEENQKALEDLKRGIKGIDISEIDVNDLDTGTIRAIKIRALEKEKTELSEKLRLTARRLDHLERAYRLEEVKHLSEDYDHQKEEDYKAWEETKDETLVEAERKHKEDVELKHRLGRLVPEYERFRKTIVQQRKADFERRRKQAQQEFERKKEHRIREFREQQTRERRQREEAERRRLEEEERIAREEEEREREEEERRERMLREKQTREEERRYAFIIYPSISNYTNSSPLAASTNKPNANANVNSRPKPNLQLAAQNVPGPTTCPHAPSPATALALPDRPRAPLHRLTEQQQQMLLLQLAALHFAYSPVAALPQVRPGVNVWPLSKGLAKRVLLLHRNLLNDQLLRVGVRCLQMTVIRLCIVVAPVVDVQRLLSERGLVVSLSAMRLLCLQQRKVVRMESIDLECSMRCARSRVRWVNLKSLGDKWQVFFISTLWRNVFLA
jgi:translation initiation factor 3 subunit A